MIDLTGKTILLTGASSGIGAATAGTLGAAGASLIAHYAGDRPAPSARPAKSPATASCCWAPTSPSPARAGRCGRRRWPGEAASTCW